MEPHDGVKWIRHDHVGSTPSARIGIGGATTGPEPQVTLVVMRGTESTRHSLRLGETFPIGGETWRLADIDFKNAYEFSICVRRVDENEPQDPPGGRIWEAAEFRPYGTLTEAEAAAAEEALGQRLPPDYRNWLVRNNGAQPVKPYRLEGRHFLMTPERPLFGLHPQYPAFDLVAAQRTWRDPFLTRSFLVIATPGGAGGLLVAKADDPNIDWIKYLPPEAMAGQMNPADRERLLRPAGRNMSYFLASLVPFEPDAPPARIIEPGAPDYRPWAH